MVTKYSGRTGSVKGRTKLVLTYSPTSVRNSTSSVKVTARLYWESTYRTQDSHNSVSMGGDLGSWSGGSSFNGTSKLLHTLTKTVSTSYSGSKLITVSGSISNVEASPGSHYVKASIRIPKRPVARPSTPTNVNMALLSDNRMKTTWSSSPSSSRPVTSYTVQYRRLDGTSWTGWKHSATVKGKSYTSNPGSNNHSYQRRVRANNSAGSSGWANSNYVQMTPYEVKNLRARVLASGSDIKVTWDYKDPAESSEFKLQLQRSVNGGSWTTVSSSFGQVKSKPYTSSYTDTNPGNGSNRYRLRILNNGEGDNSGWAESNTVSTIVPPKAPTNLSPDGSVVDFTQSVNFTWIHHDAGDGADQSHYDLRYRADGETAWTYTEAGGTFSEQSEHLFESGELVNGVDYEWQVRTQGNTKEGFGPWSKSAFVTGWTSPVVAIKEGAPPNPLTALPVPLGWTYSQDEGQGQIEWQARLYSLDSGDMFDSILDEKNAESASNSTEFTTALEDGQRYGIMVRARSSQGQWSEWSETTFDVELLVPAELRADIEYNSETGQMNLHILSDAPVQGETAEVVSIDVSRRINGGDWVPIMVGIPFDAETTLVDNIPSTWGVNEYQVTATTEAPSTGIFGPWRNTVNPYVGNTENWLFLNYGETFDYMLKMQGDLSMSGSYDRSKETQKLLGRKKPISLLGEQLSREHSVSGTVEYYEECEYPTVPDEPVELVGSPFFDDASAWDYSEVQAGPDSRVTADAHYRAKKYGYLMDAGETNTEDLVSPSPRTGVPGTEVPGRDQAEVVSRNLWLGSKLSVDRSALSGSRWADNRQTDEGWEITGGDPGTGAYSFVYTTTAYRVPVDSDVPYSWSIPMKNTGDVPFPVKLYSWLGRTTSGSVTKTDEFVLAPGETRVAKLENMITEDADDIRFSMYYNANADKPVEGAKITLLDGITLVADDVAADPFNGDGAKSNDTLLRRNVIPNPSFEHGTECWDGPRGTLTREPVTSGMVGARGAYVAQTSLSQAQLVPSLPILLEEEYAIPVVAGQWVALRFWAASEPDYQIRPLAQVYDSAGSMEQLLGEIQIPDTTAGAVFEFVFQVPADGVKILPGVAALGKVGGSGVPGPGKSLRLDSVIGMISESEGEARAMLDPYFDGDSQGTGDKAYGYEGTVGQSASTEHEAADVVAKNYSISPVSEWYLGGMSREVLDDGWSRITSTGTGYAYISSPSPWGGENPLTPISDDTEVESFEVRVPVGSEPVMVDPRHIQYDLEGKQVILAPSNQVLIPPDGVPRIVTTPINRADGAVGIRALLYLRNADNANSPDNMVEVRRGYIGHEGNFFDGSTADTVDRLYRWADDGSSIELITDSQSLYRWVGTEGDSESEKYLPAVPGYFGEYGEDIAVEDNRTYSLEAFVSAPDLRSVARRNLTSQGDFASNRQLWGSAEISGNGGSWSADEGGTVGESSAKTAAATVLLYKIYGQARVAHEVPASMIGVPGLAGKTFTVGVDMTPAEDVATAAEEQFMRFQALDANKETIQVGGSNFQYIYGSTPAEGTRLIGQVTFPANTQYFSMDVMNGSTNTEIFWDAVTFEEDVTDGDWIEDNGIREWLGAENIDVAQLMVETFDTEGVSLGVEVAGELTPDNFSSRWRTIEGEYSVGTGVSRMRVWVQWLVNGEHPERQSDWYFGGMKIRETQTVPDRWPGPDSNPDEWREAQYESTTVCLRTPSGHRIFGAMSGLEVSAVEGSLDLGAVSFTVTETDYTENPMTIDESDIWELYSAEGEVQPIQVEAQGGTDDDGTYIPPIVLDPFVVTDA